MLLGYNTNGMAHHALEDAIRLLAEIGYRSVAITIDHGALAPGRPLAAQLRRVRHLLEQTGLRSVIETGARYLLDPRRKHQPTLVSADPAERRRRITFYRHAIRCAAELRSDCVSLWSGAVCNAAVDRQTAMDRLVDELGPVLDAAAAAGVALGFEPEPGMLIDTLAGFEELRSCLAHPALRLTLDIGHLHCQGEGPLPEQIRRCSPHLVNVHLEDMCRAVHEHRMFGEGEIDFPPVLQALADSGYHGGVHVELSRHSHQAPAAARQAFEFLRPLLERVNVHA